MTIEEPDHDLAELFGVQLDKRELASLYAQLVVRAGNEGLLDVSYRTVDSPVGTLLLAATRIGLVRIAYEHEGLDAVLRTLADKVSPRILEERRRLVRRADRVALAAPVREVRELPGDLLVVQASGHAPSVRPSCPP